MTDPQLKARILQAADWSLDNDTTDKVRLAAAREALRAIRDDFYARAGADGSAPNLNAIVAEALAHLEQEQTDGQRRDQCTADASGATTEAGRQAEGGSRHPQAVQLSRGSEASGGGTGALRPADRSRDDRAAGVSEVETLLKEADASMKSINGPTYSMMAQLVQRLSAALRASETAKQQDADAWKPWLKDGETPIERIEREHRDNQALLGLLAQEKADAVALAVAQAFRDEAMQRAGGGNERLSSYGEGYMDACHQLADWCEKSMRSPVETPQLTEVQAAAFGDFALGQLAPVETPQPTGAKTDAYGEAIDDAVGHWFIQGGKAEFGDIEANNADELIAAILDRVRNPQPDAPSQPDAAPAVTPETAKELWERVVVEANNGDVEEMLSKLGDYFAADAATTDHPTVKAILTGLSETMRHASLDYYASTK